jgi:AraC-like DNA-binding protein
MDILSEVLRVVRLAGVVHFRGEFSAPWAFVSPPPDRIASRLNLAAESVTPFHVFVGGRCWVKCDEVAPLQLETGDVIVLPRGDQHIMASDLSIVPVPSKDIYPNPSTQHISVVKHGGGGETAHFICGLLHSDQRFAPLLNSLPTVICVRLRNGVVTVETDSGQGPWLQPVVEPHEAQWWQATMRYFISEATVQGEGNRAVLARLSELLFMEVMRWQLRFAAAGDRRGWLAGIGDPHIGRVLTLLHVDPARAWTVEELAQRAGLSRAALAKRFVELVGESPIQYLTEWRMHLARHLLRESGLGVGEIAGRVGYESEAAFNRAFRRSVGAPPASWRHAEIAVTAASSRVVGQKHRRAGLSGA